MRSLLAAVPPAPIDAPFFSFAGASEASRQLLLFGSEKGRAGGDFALEDGSREGLLSISEAEIADGQRRQ